jgi:predicted DCC family thiol-disulfide oxidoreductase YuxK
MMATTNNTPSSYNSIILFDGVCNFCSAVVQFVLKHDKHQRFLFSPLQSQHAQKILAKYQLSNKDLNSFILIQNNQFYTQSTAVIKVVRALAFPTNLLAIAIIIPPFICNYIYHINATNRYRWFGKKNSCYIPASNWENRFIE